MTGTRALWLVVVLAVASAAGIVGLLVSQEGGSWWLLALAAVPLIVGGWRAWALRGASSARRR